MSKVIMKAQEYLFDIQLLDSKKLYQLASFLDATRDDIEGVIEWFYSPDKYHCPTEFYYADFTEDGENVIIGFEYKEGDEIIIPKNTFIQIIHKWENLLKTKPQKIIITEENGKYSFDAEY